MVNDEFNGNEAVVEVATGNGSEVVVEVATINDSDAAVEVATGHRAAVNKLAQSAEQRREPEHF